VFQAVIVRDVSSNNSINYRGTTSLTSSTLPSIPTVQPSQQSGQQSLTLGASVGGACGGVIVFGGMGFWFLKRRRTQRNQVGIEKGG